MIPDRYPSAVWRPGPDWKQGYTFFTGYTNQCYGAGAVLHSAEGSYAGCLSVLDGPRQASWHLTFRKQGSPVQHYSLNAITWHCGRYGDDGGVVAGNATLLGLEFEGKKGEPLTENQVHHAVAFLKWYWELRELGKPSRPDKSQTFPTLSIPLIQDDELWEHKEITATECPSDRIPWDTIIEGMTPVPQPSEWESLTKGLLTDLEYFDAVILTCKEIELYRSALIASWRRSFSEPALDHATWAVVKALCQELRQHLDLLERRCSGFGRG